MGIKDKLKGMKESMSGFFIECGRVLRVTKKPTKEEYKVIVKVSAIGIAVIGLIGFLISMAAQLLKGVF